jgi:M6 family metalloprotease-like protein
LCEYNQKTYKENPVKFTRSISILFLLVLVLSACGVGAPATQAPASPVQASETPLPAPSLVPTLPATSTLAVPTVDAELMKQCKPHPISFTNVGFGFPPANYKLPSTGDVKTIVLFADFSDVHGSTTPEALFARISPNAEAFYKDLSYGRMNWVLEPHFVWLRLSHDSDYYGNAVGSYEGQLGFIQEAVKLADADVDFSTADSVVVMVPPEATQISNGPAFGANAGEGYSADGKTFSNGVTSGSDFPAWGYLWLNHESGHTMGLPDLYDYGWNGVDYDELHRFVGGFGLMGYIDGEAPEFFAFERWQLGWLADDQIVCQTGGEGTTTITPIESAGGLKAVVIPLGSNRILVVESRRALGFDSRLPKPGALVYIVDTNIASGEGTLTVYPQLQGDPYRYQSPLAAGETVTVEGVTVTVVSADAQSDTVQVTVMK